MGSIIMKILTQIGHALAYIIYYAMLAIYPVFTFIMNYWVLATIVIIFVITFGLVPWTRLSKSKARYIVTAICSIIGIFLFMQTISKYNYLTTLSHSIMYEMVASDFMEGLAAIWGVIALIIVVSAYIPILPFILIGLEYILELPGLLCSLLVGGAKYKRKVRFVCSLLVEGGAILYGVWGATYAYIYTPSLNNNVNIVSNTVMWLASVITVLVILVIPFINLLNNWNTSQITD